MKIYHGYDEKKLIVQTQDKAQNYLKKKAFHFEIITQLYHKADSGICPKADKILPLLCCQDHACWWPGDASRQGICRNGLDPNCP